MNTKKIVLGGGLVGTLLILSFFPLTSNFCLNNIFCEKIIDFIGNLVEDNLIFSLIFLTPLFFLLSLLTYRMKDEVFRAWFNFARWWVPVIIGVTIWIENAGGGGGFGGAFTIMFIGLPYYIFVTTSFAKIIHTYLKLKWETSEVKQAKLNKVFLWVYRGITLPVVLFFLWLISLKVM